MFENCPIFVGFIHNFGIEDDMIDAQFDQTSTKQVSLHQYNFPIGFSISVHCEHCALSRVFPLGKHTLTKAIRMNEYANTHRNHIHDICTMYIIEINTSKLINLSCNGN